MRRMSRLVDILGSPRVMFMSLPFDGVGSSVMNFNTQSKKAGMLIFLWTFVHRLLPFTEVLSSDRSVVLHGEAKGRLPMWAP